MKAIQKMFLCGMLAGIAVTASAQSYSYLTLQQVSGGETSLSLSGLKITFSDGNLVASNGTESATIALSDMKKLYFAAQPTGISNVENQAAEVSASIIDGRLQVTAPEGTPVIVFSVDGRRVSKDNLPAGAYVVKVGNRSLKVLSK